MISLLDDFSDETVPIVVGVGTGVSSPALAAHLRDRVADDVGGTGAMADLVADLRDRLAERGVPAGRRHAARRAVVGDEAVWTALDTGTANARVLAETVISDVTGETS